MQVINFNIENMKLKKIKYAFIIVVLLIVIFIFSLYIKNTVYNNDDARKLWNKRVENIVIDTTNVNNNIIIIE
jgi:hypothetical protein